MSSEDENFDEKTRRRIIDAKVKARPELDMCGWTKFNYVEKFDLNYRPDNCQRIRYDQVSTEEFIAKYEMKYRPIVITGVNDDNLKLMEKWNPEVSNVYGIMIPTNSKNVFHSFPAEIGEKIS